MLVMDAIFGLGGNGLLLDCLRPGLRRSLSVRTGLNVRELTGQLDTGRYVAGRCSGHWWPPVKWASSNVPIWFRDT